MYRTVDFTPDRQLLYPPIFDLALMGCPQHISPAATVTTDRKLNVYTQYNSCLGSLSTQHTTQQVTDQRRRGRANVCG